MKGTYGKMWLVQQIILNAFFGALVTWAGAPRWAGVAVWIVITYMTVVLYVLLRELRK